MKKVLFSILLVFIFLNAFSQLYEHPKTYLINKVKNEIVIDGKLDDKDWQSARKTDLFIDIEGDVNPKPYYDTYVKMLWDSNYLYFGAYLQEEHIWATLTERESIIFQDNDFEIFIDVDGDNHDYIEFEFNAFSTEWDLLLTKPYRDGGKPLFCWTCTGMKSAVDIQGTINDPSDIDTAWTIEIAIPLECLKDISKPRKKPGNLSSLRINFSRVQWETKIQDGEYVKLEKDEHNWVWSPQYAINMHKPEFWAYTVLTESYSTESDIINIGDFDDRIILMNVYYAQKEYFKKNNKYSNSLSELGLSQELYNDIGLFATDFQFTAGLNKLFINNESKLWYEK